MITFLKTLEECIVGIPEVGPAARTQYARAIAQDFLEGFWDMVPCAFNAADRQLVPHYPEKLRLIGSGIDT
ncbi:hypothetical protein ABBQ38_002476 [Trebouxia sp. C0009 RCD-2024]